MIHHRIGLVVCIIVGLSALLLIAPAIQQSREAAMRTQSRNNLKMIGQGLSAYCETHSRLPSGGIFADNGMAGVGWMVAILPYIEASSVYSQIDFNEAWDSQSNRRLLRIPHPLYQNPGEKRWSSGVGNDCAHYSANANFVYANSSVSMRDINGLSRAFLAAELGGDFVPWSSPYNFRLLKSLNADPIIYGRYDHCGAFVLFGDGRVDFVSATAATSVLMEMGGKNVSGADESAIEVTRPKEVTCSF